MQRHAFFILALGLPAVLGGCRRKEPIVARVGSQTITQSEFQRKLSEVSQSYQNYVLTPNGRRQFLDILIREKMILAAANASDVKRSGPFKAQLAQLRAEEEARLRESRDYLMVAMWLDGLREKGLLHTSEEEVRDYWRKHPVEVNVRHVLLATSNEAEAIAKKARGGANFAQLAKQHSLDAGTAADGGKMSATLYGEIIPDLEDVVFRMRIGEIGGPIKSKFGYHVVKKDNERRTDFEDVKDRILQLLEKQKLDRYLQSIQEKFPVEVVDEQFK
jgi:parvulin-like peptidyl-prolyl isomerase